MTEITTLSAQANTDLGHAADVIRRVYKQVFGNKHLMELDVNESLEALFINGDLSVQGLVTALAQSDTYKRLFLERNSPYRFVELNFKHLLGRPPHDQAELMEHVRLFAEEGYEAEITSYTYSEEYLAAFGLDQVPYNRAMGTTTGGRTVNYQRASALDVGFAGFDGNKTSRLLKSLGTDSVPALNERKAIGTAGSFTISWTSRLQVGANRRAVQKSVASQTSLSATIRGIQAQGGRIQTIEPNT